MVSWINFLILPLVIFCSVYATVLSSNLLARCEGRNKVIPLKKKKKVLADKREIVSHFSFKSQKQPGVVIYAYNPSTGGGNSSRPAWIT
jgi:hypothetical protein